MDALQAELEEHLAAGRKIGPELKETLNKIYDFFQKYYLNPIECYSDYQRWNYSMNVRPYKTISICIHIKDFEYNFFERSLPNKRKIIGWTNEIHSADLILLINKFEAMEREIERRTKENEQLKEENERLRYAPGGEGYQQAKQDFETHIKK